MMNIMEHVLQVLLLLELERFMEKIYDRICILMVVDVSLGAPCLNDFVTTHRVVHACFQGHSTGWFLSVFRFT